jgi:Patatin-like phospholipase
MSKTHANIRDDTGRARMAECDLVMKGGITSGIVYPRLVSDLSAHFRFRNIGGASAGAIAATMTAAAEAGRLAAAPGQELVPFQRLATIPDTLGRSLARLFQPSDDAGAAFDVLMALIVPRRLAFMKWPSALVVVARRRIATFAVAAVLVLVLAGLCGLFIAGCPGTALGIVLAVVRAAILAVPAAITTGLIVATAFSSWQR